MRNDIKISIIVPVYNIKEYLGRCFESILKQTYSNIEIVAVDDGSTDGSSEALDEYAKKDIRIIPIHKKNEGVTSARLTGVRISTGEYIGFVDGDDFIEPEMYEVLFNNAFKYNADISHCGYQMVFDDGRVKYFYNTGCLEEQDKVTALKELLSGERIEPGLCNKLYHRSLFDRLLHSEVMDCSIKINEDLLMNYYLFKEAEKSVYEDKCPYHYIVRHTSASRQKLNPNKIYDPIRVKKAILDDGLDEIETDTRKAYLTTCINVYNAIICDSSNAFEMDRKAVRRLLLDNKKYMGTLRVKTKLLAKIIIYAPVVYPLMYRLYARFFQRNPYS